MKKGRQFHILKPCRIYHRIGVDKDGKFAKLQYFTDVNAFENLFKEAEPSLDEILDEFEDEEYNAHNESSFQLYHDTVFELVEPGTYVGLRTALNALEIFYVAEVCSKSIATQDMCDDNGHYIMAGEKYFEIYYPQKKQGGRKSIKYQQPKKKLSIDIHVAEILTRNIALNLFIFNHLVF